MPDTGILMTRVYTGRGQFPVENAAVSIVLHGADGQQHLVNIQASDPNGNTKPTTLETPARQESLSPGQKPPFTTCDIWAECPGYQLLVIQNVQIFPGVTSIQNLPMIPLAQSTGWPAGQVNISPQNL